MVEGHIDRDYGDGYRHAYHGDGYDPDRADDASYRAGMRDGRGRRVDEELIAHYGPEPWWSEQVADADR